MDADFDGLIGKQDLSLFCMRVLNMKKH